MKYKKIFLLNFILFLSGYVCGQNTHTIFLDDSIYLKKRNSENGFYYNLKDSLPDGLWLLYDVNKKDSSSKFKSVLLKGNYKNFLKEGIFEINYYSYSGKKKIKKLTYQHICTYFNDKKNGVAEEFHIFSDTRLLLISHCEYYNGKKNGVFVNFESNGKISDVSIYANDSLKEWYCYGIFSDFKKYTEVKVLSSNNFIYIKYFYTDSIFKLELNIKNGILEKYYLYDNLGNIVDSADIGIDIHFSNPLKVPNTLSSIKEENLINRSVFKEFIEKELKK